MSSNVHAIAKRASRGLRWVLTLLVLAGWTGGWGLVTIIGWAAQLPGMMYTGLAMMGAGFLGVGGAYTVSRARLASRAESSLVARAELKGLPLTDAMAARLHVFDDAWATMEPLLGDPRLPLADQSAEVTAELAGAQSQLFRIAERYAAVQRELRALAGYGRSELVDASRRDKEAELIRLDEESEAIVKETRALASTAEDVKAIAASSAETTEKLKEAVSEFNLTLAAYREVEAETRGALPRPQRQST